MSSNEYRNGLWAATLAFVIWGLFPLYWHLLKQVPSDQIIAHRIVWSAVLLFVLLFMRERLAWLKQIRSVPRTFWLLGLASMVIGFNWSLYIWAVNAGHVVETSLGYFINPLLSVLLGVVVLGERLGKLQWLAVGLAALGVAWLTWQGGRVPWIAIGLSISFALYGLLRKLTPVEPVAGIGMESLFLFVPALAWVLWAEAGHGGGFFTGGWGWGTLALLVASGAVSAVPLIAFTYGVRRIPLSVVGLLQYIGPTLQFLCGVLVFREPFGMDRLVGFAFIWAGLVVFALAGWRAAAKARAAVG
ncbi:EamA family transporter RarD [Stenotrophomonas sp. SY1]|jgi:chloramphenicol-sensitive protein RarD|uniref:EamA family transporter RarD n=1 Tax=Stenotrophomonas sp. SY1 TaxID=477235 RepID=UPI001E32F85E|nr:EamA family transporter RarD [Stenotrophomonas sp. SY1]MCD9085578.1 EamA family transporter RarD [Stenotrophomonas sp. SY1]